MKRVALTLDDGPNGRYTLEILNILKTHNVKAAFFFCGKNIERQPDIAKRAKKEGHLIGNHTYDHPHLNTLKEEDVLWQIEKSEEIFRDILDIKPKFFRPPYGEYNDIVEKILKDKGYKLVLWDMDCYSMDWKNPAPETIADISTKRAKDGSVIVLHDGRNIKENIPRDNTIEALPCIIAALRNKDFVLVRLDGLKS